jgi:hypothetical protein
VTRCRWRNIATHAVLTVHTYEPAKSVVFADRPVLSSKRTAMLVARSTRYPSFSTSSLFLTSDGRSNLAWCRLLYVRAELSACWFADHSRESLVLVRKSDMESVDRSSPDLLVNGYIMRSDCVLSSVACSPNLYIALTLEAPTIPP